MFLHTFLYTFVVFFVYTFVNTFGDKCTLQQKLLIPGHTGRYCDQSIFDIIEFFRQIVEKKCVELEVVQIA